MTALLQNLYQQFQTNSWCKIAFDQRLLNWVQQVLPHAIDAIEHPDNQKWLRYQNTWFAGVNVLANNAQGAMADTSALECDATDFIRTALALKNIELDRGQISVCYPNYPLPTETESPRSHQYRVKRDAAHIDGLHHVGANRQRYLREQHAFILGIPLTEFSATAAPFTVWQKSHHLALSRLKNFYQRHPEKQWDSINVTDTYQQLRKEIFEKCEHVTVHALPGEAFIAHRLALHGMAPWDVNATATKHGRMICYFRPLLDNVGDWLSLP